MVKQTIRFPDLLVSCVKDEIVEEYFENKSEFHRFAAQYTLDAIGVEDESIFDEDYWDKRDDFVELSEKSDIPALRPRKKAEDAIDKIYAGYIMDNKEILQEGTVELASMVDSDLTQYAFNAMGDAQGRLSE